MSSRRGRLNWSNIDVHISDQAVDKQHRFSVVQSSSSLSSIEEKTKEENETVSTPLKRRWVPKKDAGKINVEHFVGNFMLTNDEEKTIEEKYKTSTKKIERIEASPIPKPIRFSNRLLPSNQPTDLFARATHLFIGQHLKNVFVCHVESYSYVCIMFGDNYDRATKLFEEMNHCQELLQLNNTVYEPKEKDLVAIYHEKKWFRGQCLNRIGADFNVKCTDSGATITCSSNDLRRLPDQFRTSPPCCIECTLSGLPTTIAMNSIPDTIHTECYELLYKDRYEAIITRLDSMDRPTIVLYYADTNVNDRLLAILKLL